MEQEQYQLVVVGAGPGGYVAAIKAAQLGMKTAVIEEREIGGTCLNRGCVPTKALLHASLLYKEAKDDFEKIGLAVQGIDFDIEKIYARKDEVVSQLRGGIDQLLKANKVDVFCGRGQITSPNKITVTNGDNVQEITAENIIIATGSRPSKPPIPGLELSGVLTSDELLSKGDSLAKKLVIIGGGVIGVEFATVFGALGCDVTIIEAMERILPTMDREISQNLAMILKKRGVKIYAAAMVEKLTPGTADTNALICHFTEKGKSITVDAEAVLVSIGRRANTEGLFGEGFAVEMNRAMILVNGKLQTNIPNIYAIGDVIPGIQLAHMAEAEGICAAEIIAGHTPSIRLDVVPGCIYTNPEIASVGLTPDEAKEKGIAVKTGKFIMSANCKSLIEMQDRGFIKLTFNAETNVIIGAQLMCARATDLIGELSTAIVNGLTREQLLQVIRPHPTFVEAVTEAAEAAGGMAIHTAPPKKL